jgi:carboxyl-terminal processing protease
MKRGWHAATGSLKDAAAPAAREQFFAVIRRFCGRMAPRQEYGTIVKHRMHLWLLAGLLGSAVAAAVPADSPPGTPIIAGERRSALESVSTAQDLILLERADRSPGPVHALPDEGVIARVTAGILARSHYNRQPFDDAVASRFLDRYLANLDNLRLHFLVSDIEEFEKYRTALDDMTLAGDTGPAREIFQRFLQRIEQRVAHVAGLLQTERFEFDGDDRYSLDRTKAPRPKDLEEARSIWRQHLRYEVLQELLGTKRHEWEAGQELPEEVVKTITRRYARLLKTLRDFDGADVFQYYLGALTHVYDPHSDYMGRATLENFAINMNLSLFGIGAVLQSEDGYCKVRELRPGPAMRSQRIKPGDRIVAVAQGTDGEAVDVVDMKLNKVVEMIRGPKGSEVRLTIIPVDATDPAERREVMLVRDEIRLEDEEAKARIVDLPGAEGRTTRLGVIDLPSFYRSLNLGTANGRGRSRSTTIDVAQLLDKLKREKVQGIILDLRRNTGGSLEEAIELTGLFIKSGPIVQVRDAGGRVFVDRDPGEEVLYDGPMIVLTDRFSASASEILAGCLQDYGRALVVGDSSTHGKGTVQTLVQLQPMLAHTLEDPESNPGAVKITIRKFYRASGASTQLKGVVPDVVLPSVNNHAEVGEQSLEDPLPWDTIPSARYQAENRIEPILDELRRRSEKRTTQDVDFIYINEDIELFLKRQADKTVSLNLAERLREKAELEARLEQRKAERRARPAPAHTIYEIGLQDVRLPGLPAAKDPRQPDETSILNRRLHSTLGDDDEEDDPVPAVDATLVETKRILADLVELSADRPNGYVRSP